MPSLQLSPVSRYLWVQGTSSPLPPETLLAGRYRVVQFPLVQDTSPQEPPSPLESVPPIASPYLALSAFSVAIPRPFTQVPHPNGQDDLLLLEEIPLYRLGDSDSIPGLLPTLPSVWEESTALHQLTWLWTLAELWQPCLQNQVAHVLLDWNLLRVDGEDLRLLTLETKATSPTLVDLGQQWHSLIETAADDIQPYLARVVESLLSGKATARGLISSLSQAIEFISAQQTLLAEFATCSDQGPSRKRNEDACHPESGTTEQRSVNIATMAQSPAPLVIVCDGVGGHQGGDVASRSAIAAVTQQLESLTKTANVSHPKIVSTLNQAILVANQLISERNDADQRQDRDRMGTTIVIALVYGTSLYVAHLGDSRAYRIRSYNCRQITLDDDVAVREMRLGLALYQNALQAPGSGALVQALGMARSEHLYPTVNRYPIATDSLILLCSDGLSDRGLIDRLWISELKPVLAGKRTVSTIAQRLVEIANRNNGHDNVTVGLLRLTPQLSASHSSIPVDLAHGIITPAKEVPESEYKAQTVAVPAAQDPPSSVHNRQWRPMPLLFAGILTAGLGGIIGSLGWRRFQRSVVTAPEAPVETGETLSPEASPPDSRLSDAVVSVDDYLQIQQLSASSVVATVLDINAPPSETVPEAVDLPERLLATGSIVQVITRQETADSRIWVRLNVCSIPDADTQVSSSSPVSISSENALSERSIPVIQPGDQGWLLESSISSFAEPILDISDTEQGVCTD